MKWIAGVLLGIGLIHATVDAGESWRYFEGVIGHNTHIQMTLSQKDQTFSGRYVYDRIGRPLSLEGKLHGDALTIQENTPQGEKTGKFSGTIDPESNAWSLTWTSVDGKRILPVQLNRIAQGGGEEYTGPEGSTASVHYPIFAADDNLARYVGKHVAAAMDKQHSNDLRNLKDAAREAKKESYPFRWEVSSDVNIVHATPNLISLRVQRYEYTGGAHGNTSTSSFNYGLKNGVPIKVSLASMFRAGTNYRKRLEEICLADLRRQKAGSVIDGSVKSIELAQFESVCVSPAGLEFTFDPYVMGCYAEGSYTVLVPFADLQPILAPDGPLQSVAGNALAARAPARNR